MRKTGGVSRRERLELIAVALAPAALGILRPAAVLAGRLSWLGPVIALPVGLGLCWVWGRLGEKDLSRGLRAAFGPGLGKATEALYLLWGLFLLTNSGWRYAARLSAVYEGERTRWLFLLAALAVVLWLGRSGGGAFARTGRIFFLAVAVTVGAALLLALPGVDWQNLWPPERNDWRGVPGSGALCLSLAGYGVYALCLPRREEGNMRTGAWAGWGCGALTGLLFIVVGVFGPALVMRMEDPFLYLLEGVQVPGAFRRGEAGLTAVIALADLILLTLLGRGCMSLWEGLAPALPWVGGVLVAAAVAVAGAVPEMGAAWARMEGMAPAGNLIFGVLLPAVAVLTMRVRKRRERRPIFCGDRRIKKEDVAANEKIKKSREENEKKC